MGRFIAAAVVVLMLLVAAFYPMINEGTSSSCAALERRFIAVAIADRPPEEAVAIKLAKKLLDLGKGKLAREMVRRDNPDVPAILTCYQWYWHSLFDRDWLLRQGAGLIPR